MKLEKRVFDWYRHQILVRPIAALLNELSANQKGVFSVRSDAERGFKGPVDIGEILAKLQQKIQTSSAPATVRLYGQTVKFQDS